MAPLAAGPVKPSRWWIAPAIAVKLAFALILCIQANRLKQVESFRFYDEAPDSAHHLGPIDNLLARGEYVAFADQPLTRAGRMPGYGAPYLVFRLFTGPHAARTLMICLQVVTAGVAAYYFALTVFLLLGRRSAFYLGLTLYSFALFLSDWDYRLLTESLAASSVVFYLYALTRYRLERRRRWLLLAGAWFAFLVFLRPFTIPFFLVAIPFVWPAQGPWRPQLRRIAADLTLVGLIFGLADLAWIARNYRVFGKIVPTQITSTAGYNYTPAQLAQFAWLGSLGQNLAPLPQNAAAWSRPRVGFAHDRFVMPAYAFSSRCQMADLERAKALFDVAVYETRPEVAGPADRQATEIFLRCRDGVRQERPVRYWVLSPLRLVKEMYLHSGPTLSLPPFRSFLNRPPLVALKLFAVGSYWLIMVSGVAGLVLAARRRDPRLLAAAGPLLFVTVLFPVVFRTPEIRYQTTGYPALLLLSVLALDGLLRKAWQKRFRPAT